MPSTAPTGGVEPGGKPLVRGLPAGDAQPGAINPEDDESALVDESVQPADPLPAAMHEQRDQYRCPANQQLAEGLKADASRARSQRASHRGTGRDKAITQRGRFTQSPEDRCGHQLQGRPAGGLAEADLFEDAGLDELLNPHGLRLRRGLRSDVLVGHESDSVPRWR